MFKFILAKLMTQPIVVTFPTPPTTQKVTAKKVKVGEKITLTGNLRGDLTEEGFSKFRYREHQMPKGDLTVVAKHPEKRYPTNPGFLIKLEDGNGQRFNLRVFQETWLLVVK